MCVSVRESEETGPGQAESVDGTSGTSGSDKCLNAIMVINLEQQDTVQQLTKIHPYFCVQKKKKHLFSCSAQSEYCHL